MSGIICCACLTLVISVLQFTLLQWRDDLNKIQEKNESQRNQNLWWILLQGRHRSCRLQLQWDRWREIMENKILGVLLLQMIDQGNLMNSPPQFIQNWSQEWQSEVTTHDRSRQPDKASWRMIQQVRPHHETTLLDGTAQSVRYGEPLRDRSGQLDNVNSQEAAPKHPEHPNTLNTKTPWTPEHPEHPEHTWTPEPPKPPKHLNT